MVGGWFAEKNEKGVFQFREVREVVVRAATELVVVWFQL